MRTDGIYRVSGNLSQVQKLRFQIDQDKYSGMESEEDVNVLTGLLKLFFRELREPMIPFHLYDALMKANSESKKKLFSGPKSIVNTRGHSEIIDTPPPLLERKRKDFSETFRSFAFSFDDPRDLIVQGKSFRTLKRKEKSIQIPKISNFEFCIEGFCWLIDFALFGCLELLDKSGKERRFRDLVSQLPGPNAETFRFLFQHLYRYWPILRWSTIFSFPFWRDKKWKKHRNFSDRWIKSINQA